MTHEVHTFKEWGYPFIAEDYAEEIGESLEKCSGCLLGGIVLDNTDVFNPSDEYAWARVIAQVTDFIQANIPAIMVELCHLSPEYGEAAEHDLTEYFLKNGYKDLRSYENRLAFGKF